MYIHMFAFRFKSDVTMDKKKEIVAAIAALQNEVPEVLEAWVGPNESPHGEGYELGGVMKFADAAAFKRYEVHRAHQQLLSWLMPLIEPVEVDFAPSPPVTG